MILSFKLTKKNYCKLFAITLKTILKLFFILPMPWAIKQYATKTFLIFKTTKFGGDDGIRTHDLLNAIQTRSQLRHAPKKSKTSPVHYIKNISNKQIFFKKH